MWEFDWGSTERSATSIPASTARRAVLVGPTFWEEHCTECAVPDCYSTCLLYTPRADGGCHRFTGGIRRVPGASGRFGDGARIRFERWGKLQTIVPLNVCALSTYRLFGFVDRLIRALSGTPYPRWLWQRLTAAWIWRRPLLAASLGRRPVNWTLCWLEMVLENQGGTVGLSVELLNEGVGVGRTHLVVPRGVSTHRIGASELGLGVDRGICHLRVVPDGDESCELSFFQLEILQGPVAAEMTSEADERPDGETLGSSDLFSLSEHSPTYVQEADPTGELDTNSAAFAKEHVEFLLSCQVELCLESELDEVHVDRMVELLARSDQLNLSGRQFDRSAFLASHGKNSVWFAGTCRDRFGDYGLVLAARAVVGNTTIEVTDFVISCRVAEKAVENAFFEWLRTEHSCGGVDTVIAAFVPCSRNEPLQRALWRCGFELNPKGPGMLINASTPVQDGDIVQVTTVPPGYPD